MQERERERRREGEGGEREIEEKIKETSNLSKLNVFFLIL